MAAVKSRAESDGGAGGSCDKLLNRINRIKDRKVKVKVQQQSLGLLAILSHQTTLLDLFGDS